MFDKVIFAISGNSSLTGWSIGTLITLGGMSGIDMSTMVTLTDGLRLAFQEWVGICVLQNIIFYARKLVDVYFMYNFLLITVSMYSCVEFIGAPTYF